MNLTPDSFSNNCIAKRLKVNGIVQGVGFRPFVFQLAQKYELKGVVANTSSGVAIHVEGLAEHVTSFESDLATKAPPLAYAVNISSEKATVKHYADFAIVKSRSESDMSTLISPDVSVCDDCLAELLDPCDRRYRYPFINCTNCGPRYTIIDDIPYDRPKTSMRYFKMCLHARPSTMTPPIGVFMPSPMPVMIADPTWVFSTTSKTRLANRILSVKPSNS